MQKGDLAIDSRGLIREAYRIEGIGPADCRTIFLDWALSLPEGTDTRAALEALGVDGIQGYLTGKPAPFEPAGC